MKPQIVSGVSRASAEIPSPAGANLFGLNAILQTYQLERAESSFGTSEHEASLARAAPQQPGVDVPHLGNFVTLHFPPDADTQHIAEELSVLPEVERAVAVPRAIPPDTPSNEPLVGSSDQGRIESRDRLRESPQAVRCSIKRDAGDLASRDRGVGIRKEG